MLLLTGKAAGGAQAPSVLPPIPPSAYTIPGGAVTVTTASALRTQLASTPAKDIILANGTYDGTGAFVGNSHRLWAQNLGGATLTRGITFAANGELHGIRVDISGGGVFSNEAVVYCSGNGLKVQDCWVTGRSTRYLSGIRTYGNSGFKINRCVVRNVTYNGVLQSDDLVNATPAVAGEFTDLYISGVYDTVGNLDGTAEAGLWVEHTCTVARIKIRQTGWMGIATEVNVNDSTFTDLDIDDLHASGVGNGVAFYIEHWTRRCTIEHFIFGAGTGEGFQSEWDSPSWNNTGAGTDNILRNGTILSTRDGGYPDSGTLRMRIENVAFSGQQICGIVNKGTDTQIINCTFGTPHPPGYLGDIITYQPW